MSIDLVGLFAVIVMVCAAIYLLAAVVERPLVTWLGFACSVPFVAVGVVLGDERISLGLVGLVQATLVIVGAVRHRWRAAASRRQLVAAVGFSALAVLAVVTDGMVVAGVLVIAGLLGHTAWDVWHHRRREVVPPAYAAFCAALDLVLAAAVIVVLLSAA